MTNQEFIATIEAYRFQARQLLAGDGGFNIKRGMAHTMSGYVEDLFALFVAQKINRNDLQFLVDKVTSIRFENSPKAIFFKPDLAILDSNILTHYFDVKTNMGWNRDFKVYLNEKNQFIESLQGKAAWIRHSKIDLQPIELSHTLMYQMVIVYGWNIRQDFLRENLKAAESFPNVKVHVLYTQQEDGSGFGINEAAFDALDKTLLQ